jgi:hypothetical protein
MLQVWKFKTLSKVLELPLLSKTTPNTITSRYCNPYQLNSKPIFKKVLESLPLAEKA